MNYRSVVAECVVRSVPTAIKIKFTPLCLRQFAGTHERQQHKLDQIVCLNIYAMSIPNTLLE